MLVVQWYVKSAAVCQNDATETSTGQQYQRRHVTTNYTNVYTNKYVRSWLLMVSKKGFSIKNTWNIPSSFVFLHLRHLKYWKALSPFLVRHAYEYQWLKYSEFIVNITIHGSIEQLWTCLSEICCEWVGEFRTYGKSSFQSARILQMSSTDCMRTCCQLQRVARRTPSQCWAVLIKIRL